jgi:hypothetical protein
MTKKHFIRFADYLTDAEIRKYCNTITDGTDEAYVKLDDLKKHLANFCHEMNPRFDRWRWLNYISGECGPNDGKR